MKTFENENAKIPARGTAFIAWKRCVDRNGSPILVKLQIPARAQRIQTDIPQFKEHRKCRSDYAKVIEVVGADIAYSAREQEKYWEQRHFARKEPPIQKFVGAYEAILLTLTQYKVGKKVVADLLDKNPAAQCSNGINFFLSRDAAEQYEDRFALPVKE